MQKQDFIQVQTSIRSNTLCSVGVPLYGVADVTK